MFIKICNFLKSSVSKRGLVTMAGGILLKGIFERKKAHKVTSKNIKLRLPRTEINLSLEGVAVVYRRGSYFKGRKVKEQVYSG